MQPLPEERESDCVGVLVLVWLECVAPFSSAFEARAQHQEQQIIDRDCSLLLHMDSST
jgi:hypothetical protein